MSSVRRPFCSDAARLRGDDNAGTAARVDVWLLVELPITWGRDPLVEASMPAAVRETLQKALAEIPRSKLLFIRRRVESPGPTRVYVVRSAPRPGAVMLELPSLDDVATVPFVQLAAETKPMPTPLVLVCTHGQRDSCCGRRGYPLYDALRERDDLDVWQCSHVGGDRFAANALVLPWGLYYGPVEPRDAEMFAESIKRDEIFLPGYRGRSSLSRPVQAAETFVRRASHVLTRDAFRLQSRELLLDGRMHITLRDTNGTMHDVTLEHHVATAAAYGTCYVKAEHPIREFRLVEYRMT
ncbi:MAG TPA: sucrase ferredoxin [Thermoanaerobaculia bacterium]